MDRETKEYDIESGEKAVLPEDSIVTHGETFDAGNSMYARLQRFAGKFGVEQRGIERVPENERTDTSLHNIGTMWLAANMVVSSFAIGLLGTGLFGMGFGDSCLTIVFINLLGITPVSYFSTFGPKFGLRQMVLSRYWFGFHGVKVIAFFNVLACIGWSSVNTIVGAQLLYSVQNKCPGWAGILVIAVCTFLVTLFGYKVVHAYEKWSWIPSFIVFLIVLGVFAHSGDFVNLPMEVGVTEAGSVLSFASAIYGFATGWASYAADYTVYQPPTQSRLKVFIWTYLGLAFPLLFTQLLGAAVMTATLNSSTTIYSDGYKSASTGGLLAAVLINHLGGFGRFCLVVLALSIIANNCPNIYSVSLSMQVMARQSQRVPRYVWTALGTCAYIAIAIPGYSHFETVLEDFMNLIGYWLAIYEGIALTEHLWFMRGFSGYDISIFEKPSLLPPGFAAMLAFCVGVAGAVVGMDQSWYIGPLAKKIGEFGGDIGFELAFGFAAVTYFVARTFEKKNFGR